ncbi:MAG: sulfur carrier protein ThiS [Acidobacteriota bacterium]
MQILLNGELREVPQDCMLPQLLEQLGLKATRIAIELNRQILRQPDWPHTQLREGDRIEIVHFVGGG